MNTLAIDFESVYDRDYSLKKMGVYNYVYHPRFDAYLMSICGNTTSGPFEWVGHPRDFNQWELLNGATLVAHNAAFDSLVFKRLQEIGTIPPIGKPTWRCTASMAVYLSAPRSLKGACKQLLGIDVDKSQRDKAQGQGGAAGELVGLIHRGGDAKRGGIVRCCRVYVEVAEPGLFVRVLLLAG